jgi:Protein of unknown function (DUF2490).
MMINGKNRFNSLQLPNDCGYPAVKPMVKIMAVLIVFLTTHLAQAQDVSNELEYRSALDLSYKLTKKLEVSFMPEMRFNERFNLNKCLFEGGLTYKPEKYVALEGTYRYVINPRKKKDTEYFNQYTFSAKVEKKLGRFNPSFRIRYANNADDEITDEEFLRYKFSFDYNIPKCKLTPEIAVEAFQQLGSVGGMYKMRYSAGIDYKIFKNNYLCASYKFDYYYKEYLNKHIVGLGYKIKL